jgi:hypothetical protein
VSSRPKEQARTVKMPIESESFRRFEEIITAGLREYREEEAKREGRTTRTG